MPLIEPTHTEGFSRLLARGNDPRRERLITTAPEPSIARFGYSPIRHTPLSSNLEVLKGKGGDESDRLMYEFEDHGGRQVGMRFDLTVSPSAFCCSACHSELGLPFKRYQYWEPVWPRWKNNQSRPRYPRVSCSAILTRLARVFRRIRHRKPPLVIHELPPQNRRCVQSRPCRSRSASTTAPVPQRPSWPSLGTLEKSTAIPAGPRQARKNRPRKKVADEWFSAAGATPDQRPLKFLKAGPKLERPQPTTVLSRSVVIYWWAMPKAKKELNALRQILAGREGPAGVADGRRLSLDVSIARRPRLLQTGAIF